MTSPHHPWIDPTCTRPCCAPDDDPRFAEHLLDDTIEDVHYRMTAAWPHLTHDEREALVHCVQTDAARLLRTARHSQHERTLFDHLATLAAS
jgi:hypothetical protein